MEKTKINSSQPTFPSLTKGSRTPVLPKIPGYKVTSRIGQGGMASVYHAIELAHNRQVALKVISESSMGVDDLIVERFRREANAGFQLSHKNVVPVFSYGSEGEHHFIAMDLMRGGSLKDKLACGLPIKAGLNIVVELADALDYLNSQGFMHRDIKPENILFRERDNTPLLADFGIAQQYDSDLSRLTMHGDVSYVGSPSYMSPERFEGKMPDIRSELYSLGIVLFKILSGVVPFSCALNDYAVIANGHLNNSVPLLPLKVRQYQRIIEKVLAKQPKDRYQSGAALIAAIRNVDLRNAQLTNLTAHNSAGSTLEKIDRIVLKTGLDRMLPGWRVGNYRFAFGVVFTMVFVFASGVYWNVLQHPDLTEMDQQGRVAGVSPDPVTEAEKPEPSLSSEDTVLSEIALVTETDDGSDLTQPLDIPLNSPSDVDAKKVVTAEQELVDPLQSDGEPLGLKSEVEIGVQDLPTELEPLPEKPLEAEQEESAADQLVEEKQGSSTEVVNWEPDPRQKAIDEVRQRISVLERSPESLRNNLTKASFYRELIMLAPNDKLAVKQLAQQERDIYQQVASTIEENNLLKAKREMRAIERSGVALEKFDELKVLYIGLETQLSTEVAIANAKLQSDQVGSKAGLAELISGVTRIEQKFGEPGLAQTFKIKESAIEHYSKRIKQLSSAGNAGEAEGLLTLLRSSEFTTQSKLAELEKFILSGSRDALDRHQGQIRELLIGMNIDEAMRYYNANVKPLQPVAAYREKKRMLEEKVNRAAEVKRMIDGSAYYKAAEALKASKTYFDQREFKVMKDHIEILMIGDSI